MTIFYTIYIIQSLFSHFQDTQRYLLYRVSLGKSERVHDQRPDLHVRTDVKGQHATSQDTIKRSE